MSAVAEGLVGARPTTTQTRRFHARDHAARAADDLHVAADLQGTVGLRIDREWSITHRQHVGLAGGRLAARDELYFVVRAVAERLVPGGAAAAQRHAVAEARRSIELDVGAEGVGPVLAHRYEIHLRSLLVGLAVLSFVTNGAG